MQIFRSLSYIHRCIGVCHRDIKPQNLLVNPHTHQVKLCDFGSAKVLVSNVWWIFLSLKQRSLSVYLITDDSWNRLKESQTFHIYAQGITEHLSLFLEPLSILQPLMFGLQDVFLPSFFSDRLYSLQFILYIAVDFKIYLIISVILYFLIYKFDSFSTFSLSFSSLINQTK